MDYSTKGIQLRKLEKTAMFAKYWGTETLDAQVHAALQNEALH